MHVTLLYPLFAWLLPLALLPVIFHLFFRVRRRALPFSTFMFFHRVDPRLSARRKLREWLVLILRALAVALLLAALARPVWVGAGSGGRVAAVLVVDNSASMTGPAPDGRPKLERAAAAARAAAGTLRPGDLGALVLTVDDPAAALPPGLASDRGALEQAIRTIPPTEAEGRPHDALGRAVALLDAAPAARREIHVFTDLQAGEWGRAPAAPLAARPGISVQVHRIASEPHPPPNVALASVSLPAFRGVAGRRFPVSITLANASAAQAEVRLTWEDDEGRRGTEPVLVPASGESALSIPLAPVSPGFHSLSLAVEGDAFAADNRATVGYVAAARMPVLFAGGPADFGLLPAAFAPTGDGALSGLEPSYAPSASLPAAIAELKPLLVVAGWDALAVAPAPVSAAIGQYVAEGGRLLVVPLPGRAAGGPVPAWVGARPGPETALDPAPALIPFHGSHFVFDSLRDAKGDLMLRSVRVSRACPLTPAEGAVVLAGLEDGRPLLAVTPAGRGLVFASGLAFVPEWSNLPLKGASLALVHAFALGAAQGVPGCRLLTAGDHPPSSAGGTARLAAVTPPPLQWEGRADAPPALPRAGLFTLETTGGVERIAVRAAPAEGRADWLASGDVPAAAGLACDVRDLDDDAGMAARIARLRTGLDLYVPALLACLAALFAEGLAANRPPMKMRAEGGL